MFCASVILFESDRAAVFILRFEGEDVFYIRAAEFIYALVVISDNSEVPVAAEQ